MTLGPWRAMKSFKVSIYPSFAPKSTLLAKFCMILAIKTSPRRNSGGGEVDVKPCSLGEQIAGQKNLKKMKDPTALYLASGNFVVTEVDICWKKLAADDMRRSCANGES